MRRHIARQELSCKLQGLSDRQEVQRMLQRRKPSTAHAFPPPQARRKKDDCCRGSPWREAWRPGSSDGSAKGKLVARSGRGHRRRQRIAHGRRKPCIPITAPPSDSIPTAACTDEDGGQSTTYANNTLNSIDGHRQHCGQDGAVLSLLRRKGPLG
jgi:hypothetical protein